MKALAIVAVLIAAVASCDRPASSDERGAVRNSASTPRTVIDSALPPEELLRRFRVGLDSVGQLDGPRSRDELVKQFLAAVRKKDRAAAEQLGISRAEFAWLLFPDSKQSKPPYNQPPDIAWLLLSARSEGSLTKLLARADNLEIGKYSCTAAAERDGAANYQPGCTVAVTSDGQTKPLRLFGSIVELNGRFKFFDLGNSY